MPYDNCLSRGIGVGTVGRGQDVLACCGVTLNAADLSRPHLCAVVLLEASSLEDVQTYIAILVLGTSDSKEGPGPLVTAVAGKGAAFPIPVTVVPHNLTDEDIADLA